MTPPGWGAPCGRGRRGAAPAGATPASRARVTGSASENKRAPSP